MNNKLKSIINYIVKWTETASEGLTNQDICLIILYYNYMMLRDTNNPGVITTIISYRTNTSYKFFLEDCKVSSILYDIIREPVDELLLSTEDKKYLDESIKQWRLGRNAFEELLDMILHIKSRVTKSIIDLPRILYFACNNKSEYSVLLSRLTKLIEQDEQ